MTTKTKTAAKKAEPTIIAAPTVGVAPVDSKVLTPAEAAKGDAQPTMSMAVASKTWDTEAMRAQAVMASQAHIRQIERDERMSIGTWIDLPFGLERWHFIRCGRKSDPRAVAMFRRLTRSGYVPAPPQVRLIGFEGEGSEGLYTCCPPEVREKMQDAKRRLRKSSQRNVSQTFEGMLGKSLGGVRGVEVDTYDPRKR